MTPRFFATPPEFRAFKMTEAGRRAFAARTAARTGVYSFERKTVAKLEPEQEKKLRANRRERRLGELIACCAEGRTIGPLTRPAAKKKKKR